MGKEYNVLLTGATGFLGSYLLAELLRQGENEIFVLVRAQNEELGLERVRQKQTRLFLWDELKADRIHVICGDLSLDHLGIAEDKWQWLANHIDVIIHNGAHVNLIGTYKKHYAPNVSSTLELLSLACEAKKKRFSYVSTSGIFSSMFRTMDNLENYVIAEDIKVPEANSIFAYLNTKWIAENAVREAGEKGVDVAIFRLPHISGDDKTGYFTKGDQFWIRLKALATLGKAPDIDYRFYISPVDFVARALVYISLTEFTGLNFYIPVSNNKTTWLTVSEAVRKNGYDVEIVKSEKWYEYVKEYLKNHRDKYVNETFAYATNNFRLFVYPTLSNQHFMESLPEEMRECRSMDKIVSSYFKYERENL